MAKYKIPNQDLFETLSEVEQEGVNGGGGNESIVPLEQIVEALQRSNKVSLSPTTEVQKLVKVDRDRSQGPIKISAEEFKLLQQEKMLQQYPN